jgi:hypothetical protein
LAAVAGQGFTELTEAMRAAATNEEVSLGRLRCAGLAYVEFALHGGNISQLCSMRRSRMPTTWLARPECKPFRR